jgi:hypothetical protein
MKLNLISLTILASILLTGCTKSGLAKIVDASGAICEVVLQEKAPDAAPFCATAEEIAKAIIEITNLPAAKAGSPVPVTQAGLKAKVLEMRKASAKK